MGQILYLFSYSYRLVNSQFYCLYQLFHFLVSFELSLYCCKRTIFDICFRLLVWCFDWYFSSSTRILSANCCMTNQWFRSLSVIVELLSIKSKFKIYSSVRDTFQSWHSATSYEILPAKSSKLIEVNENSFATTVFNIISRYILWK